MINATTDKDHSRAIVPITNIVWHSDVLPWHKVCLVDETNVDAVVSEELNQLQFLIANAVSIPII
jgi:hypothetical protein